MYVECDDCGWTANIADDDETFGLHTVHHLYERLTPGGVVPAGECPSCGSFAYIQPGLSPDEARQLLEQLAREEAAIQARCNDELRTIGTRRATVRDRCSHTDSIKYWTDPAGGFGGHYFCSACTQEFGKKHPFGVE